MKGSHAQHFGFNFNYTPAALQAIAFGLGGRADLRAAEQLAFRQPANLLHQIFLHLGGRFQEGNRQGFEIVIDASEALRQRLEETLARHLTQVWIESRNPAWEAVLASTLHGLPVVIQRVDHTPSLHDLRAGGLLIQDWAAVRPSASQAGRGLIDSMVQVRLINEMDFDTFAADRGGTDFMIPVRGSRDAVALDAESQGLVREALAMAGFSRAWEAMRRSRLRWRLKHTFAFDPAEERVEITLDLEAEDRVLASQDLRLGVTWSEPPRERFSDVAGHAEAISVGQEAVAWLANPNSAGGLRAFVVDGPPGVGKSLFCAAIAGEAQVACIRMAASEWTGIWWGETEKAIRSTFQALSQYEACVLVVEEFEAIAYARDRASLSNPAYFASIMGTLLTSLDRLRQGPARVLVVATTNHYDQLDPSVVRSLRMDRLHLGLPSTLDRRQLLNTLGLDSLCAEELDEAALMTSGLSQADLVSLGAKFLAAGTEHGFSTFQDLVVAQRRGPRDATHVLSPEAKARVAVHEAGHALAAYFLVGPDSVEQLSLIPAIGGSGGAFCFRPAAAQTLFGADAQKRHIAVYLAGRAAERLLFPEDGGSQGAGADLRLATELAVTAVGELGMDAGFSGVAFSSLPESVCQYLAPRLAECVQAWLSEAAACVDSLLQSHRVLLQNLADALVQEETLRRARILALIESE